MTFPTINHIDDVLPLLDADDRSLIEAYRDAVEEGLSRTAEELAGHVYGGRDLDQKAFATVHQQGVVPALRPLAFQVRSGSSATEAVRSAVLKSSGSQTAVDSARHLHGAIWPL